MRQRNLISETEIPGTKVGIQQLQMICYRYYFASQFVQGKQVLEVGCGPGLGLGYLARNAKKVIGGDCTEESLRCAQDNYRERKNIELLVLDAHMLPFKEVCFDVVVAMETIFYLNLDKFLDECHRILERDGIFVFCIPNKDRPNFQPSCLSHKYYSVPELFSLMNHRFDVKFFGAFSNTRTETKLNNLITTGAKIINRFEFIPAMTRFKEIFKKLIGYRTFILKTEIDDEDIKLLQNIQLVPIDCNSPDFKHLFLYGIARRR